MKFLYATTNEMNNVAAIHGGITGIHTIIQITSQILLKLLIAEVFSADLTERTFLLMSKKPLWRRKFTSRPISATAEQAITSQSSSLTSVTKNPRQKQLPTEVVLNRFRTQTSSYQTLGLSSRTGFQVDDQNPEGAKPKRVPNALLNNVGPHWKVGWMSNRRTTRQLPKGSSVTPSTTESQLSTKSGQSTIRSTPLQQWRTEGQPKSLKLRHRRINSQSPHLKIDHRPDIDGTVSHRLVTRNDSNRPSISSQKTIVDEIPNNEPSSVIVSETAPETKSKRRPKRELSVHTRNFRRTVIKARNTLPVKLRKRLKKKKFGRGKNSSSSESSDALGELSENSGLVGVKLIAAGQHGFLKNASTGSDTPESSFTVVNVDPLPADLIKDHVKNTRVAGTWIQNELLLKSRVAFPHPCHRSVFIQADGSDKTPNDAKALFQKFLPRINALSTKHKQSSGNASGQSSYSSFSNARSYHGSQSVRTQSLLSCSQRGCLNSVDVQYASSGSVKAVLRVTSNLHSKYSSRGSAVLSCDRLAPIIQGVSLTPPRTPPTNNLPKPSKSLTSRSGPTKKRS